MLFFAAFGARIVLHESPTRHAAGAVNRALLDALDLTSYVCVALLLVLFLVWRRSEEWRKGPRAITIRLLLLAGAAALVSHLLITPEMMTLRARMGVIDVVPKSDPLRKEWGRLHGLSTLSLLIRLLASAGLFFAALSPTVPAPRVLLARDEEPAPEPQPTGERGAPSEPPEPPGHS